MEKASLQQTDFSTPIITNTGLPTVAASDHISVLSDIYQDAYNIAIWERDLPPTLQSDVKQLLAANNALQVSLTVTPQNCLTDLREALKDYPNTLALIADIALLVELFCNLFELKQTELKLTALDQVMCPRFHHDNVPCRLVTTYVGCSTQWLPHQAVDRSKLGRGNNGLPDERSGIYRDPEDIQQLTNGDVALLKGARWEGSQYTSLVHRSPTPKPGELRLLLTLDFVTADKDRLLNR